MKKEITYKQFLEATEIIERYKYQEDKTFQASVTYNASVSVTVKVPRDWNSDKIIEELKDGYYRFSKEDAEDIKLGEITELIVDGYYVKLP